MTPWTCAACGFRNYGPGRCGGCDQEPVLIHGGVGLDNVGRGALFWAALAGLAMLLAGALTLALI